MAPQSKMWNEWWTLDSWDVHVSQMAFLSKKKKKKACLWAIFGFQLATPMIK